MQAVDGYWYDPSDPQRVNPYADCLDAFAFSPNRYRIAVRHHYSLWQILALKNKYRKEKERQEIIYMEDENID